MANYDNLVVSIKDAIKNNNKQAITGQVLQDTLLDIVAQLGKNYAFGGVATPSTNPGTPTTNTFYIATEAGTYINMGGVVLESSGLNAIIWDGDKWLSTRIADNVTAEEVVQIIEDNTLSALNKTSNKPVSGKGIADAIDAIFREDEFVEVAEMHPQAKYVTGVSVGSTISPSRSYDSSIYSWETLCNKGDIFRIVGNGASSGRLWCFTDADYKVLSVAVAYAAHRDTVVEIEAPEGSSYLFVNLNNYDPELDSIYIGEKGYWQKKIIRTVPQNLSLEAQEQAGENIGTGVIEISDWWYENALENTAQNWYDYKSKKLIGAATSIPNKNTTYSLGGRLYRWDGEKLITDNGCTDKKNLADWSNITVSNNSVTGSGVVGGTNTSRLCTQLLKIQQGARLKVKDGYAFYYYLYDENGAFKGANESNNTEVEFDGIPCLVRIVFKKLDNSVISATDDIIDTFSNIYHPAGAVRALRFTDITPWEPEIVDEGYSNPTSGWGQDTKRAEWSADDKYMYYEFLEHYYDSYLGKREGHKVSKRGLWVDSANTGHEVFEYDFCPDNYCYTIMLSAGMNADETQGIWGLATFIRCLMNEEEPQLVLMKKNIRFKVIPIINASGFDMATLRYTYANGVNPNFNFNYKDSWARHDVDISLKGEYPDNCLETIGLKRWINEHSGAAVLWLDLHTGRWQNEYPNTKIIDARFSSEATYFSSFNSVHLPLIKQFYLGKGYITSSDNIGSAYSVRENLDYQKHRYALDVCGINSAMPEMHLESTGYGSDGFTNNSPEGIKAYVLQIRQLIMFAINK